MANIQERFDVFVKKSFDWAVKEYPIYATFIGIHDYDDQLGDNSRSRIRQRIAEEKRALRELLRFDPKRLDFNRAIDWNVLRCSLETSIYAAEELRSHERDPDYVSAIAEGVYPLFVRDFAPPAVRFQNIASRIRGTGKFLQQGRENVTKPVKVLCEVALEGIPRTIGFLKLISAESRNLVDQYLSSDIASAVEGAAKEIQSYQDHVKSFLPKANPNFAMGSAKFQKLLRLRRLPFKMQEMLRIGRRVLKTRHTQLDQLADKIKPGAKWRDVGESLKANPPADFKHVWSDYETVTNNARDFVRGHQLVSIPETDSLRFVETPSYVRHVIPTAAYLSPAAFDKDQTGMFFVTPVEDKTELLKEHSHQFVVTTVVHEGYPGHHLHLSWANKNPSIARRLFSDAALVEGWAHYCEEAMFEENHFEDEPAVKFAFLQDAAWRAARVIVDIGLHTGKMTFDQAVQFLVDNTGMEVERARREVMRYVGTPGQPLSYLIGKEIIKVLRKKAKGKLRSKYSDRLFHDRLMQAGMVTFKDLERVVLAPVK